MNFMVATSLLARWPLSVDDDNDNALTTSQLPRVTVTKRTKRKLNEM